MHPPSFSVFSPSYPLTCEVFFFLDVGTPSLWGRRKSSPQAADRQSFPSGRFSPFFFHGGRIPFSLLFLPIHGFGEASLFSLPTDGLGRFTSLCVRPPLLQSFFLFSLTREDLRVFHGSMNDDTSFSVTVDIRFVRLHSFRVKRSVAFSIRRRLAFLLFSSGSRREVKIYVVLPLCYTCI